MGRPCEAEFEVTKEYAGHLREKVGIFKQYTHPEKNVPLTLLTVFGVKRNEHFWQQLRRTYPGCIV